MPAGPWTPLDGTSTSSAPTSRPGQQQQQQQQAQQPHQQQQQRLLPVRPPAAAQEPAIPLAEGRLVLGLVWTSRRSLLLLAANYPAEEGLEAGEGTVLIEASVQLPSELCQAATAGAAGLGSAELVHMYQAGSEPLTAVLRMSYAGGQVLAAAAHPAGGAVLQLHGGPAVYYTADGQLLQLQGQAGFGAPCRTIKVLPNARPGAGTAAANNSSLHLGVLPAPAAAGTSSIISSSSQRAAAVAATAPALGLTPQGALYWGSKLLASDVTSFAVRGGGPGGAAVLYVTRQALLYVAMVSQLPSYVHTLPDESTAAVSYRPSEYPGDLRAAMALAMRPGGAAAAARDPHVRALEPGALVLASPWGDVGAILQMQRGNLEGVSPRLLVLAAICDALEQRLYAPAWQLAVTHRADLNLLVDYAWPRVVQDAAQFVAAVREPSDLCDLLFALQPGSVLQQGAVYGSLHQMLGWQQQQQQQQQQVAAGAAATGLASLAVGQAANEAGGAKDDSAAAVDGSNKVSAVCAALRQAVLQLPRRYLQGHLKTVAISYARSDPSSLEAALIAIREVKEASVSSSTTAAAAPAAPDSAAAAVAAAVAVTPQEAACPAELGSAADAALKHLLLYVDVDQLYRTALGLYDLSLAFMVVGHSQKDPGEYLAELTAFGSQADVSLRCHAIDMSLGHYDKALAHLVAAGPTHFQAALKLAKDRGLLRQLLALTQQQQQQQQQAAGGSGEQRLVAVLSAYGDALLDARKPEDAAVAYSAAGLTEQALGAYKAANAWRMCMVLSARLQQSQQQQQALARELAEQLQASGSGADAAQLLAQYLGDVDGAVAALVAAKEWREALRVAYAAGRQDLVDTTVVPGAAQAAASLMEEATESTERITKYSARLKEVRGRRLAMEAALAAAEAEAAGQAGPDDDLASEAGVSLISGLSVYTERTGAGMTGFGSSIASSSRAASTVGGRKPLRHEKKSAAKQKKGKIRAGSPGEEAALGEHLVTLAPPKHALEEAGQLAELLVMLQHVGDATKLQQRVAQWQAAAAAAVEEVATSQQQQGASGAAGVQQLVRQRPAAAGGAAVVGSKAAVEEVRWKWDVLRDHK
ncbi:IKI3 family-domain-containing protein [Scenedesmus sp. NREL 46B-D3]|nr:IKI3 family-domain-containing protein [Scenedesmus sp. NREL 46B-D3]